MTTSRSKFRGLGTRNDGYCSPSPLDKALIAHTGVWHWCWVPYSDFYPIELVDEVDEISGDQQYVLLWKPNGWTTDQSIRLLEFYCRCIA